MQKVKLTDLKIGDKVQYTDKDLEEIDIGILTKIEDKYENKYYWFKWENESTEMYLRDTDNYELKLIDTPKVFTDEELIQELRNRGYYGNLTKITTITLVV